MFTPELRSFSCFCIDLGGLDPRAFKSRRARFLVLAAPVLKLHVPAMSVTSSLPYMFALRAPFLVKRFCCLCAGIRQAVNESTGVGLV